MRHLLVLAHALASCPSPELHSSHTWPWADGPAAPVGVEAGPGCSSWLLLGMVMLTMLLRGGNLSARSLSQAQPEAAVGQLPGHGSI